MQTVAGGTSEECNVRIVVARGASIDSSTFSEARPGGYGNAPPGVLGAECLDGCPRSEQVPTPGHKHEPGTSYVDTSEGWLFRQTG